LSSEDYILTIMISVARYKRMNIYMGRLACRCL